MIVVAQNVVRRRVEAGKVRGNGGCGVVKSWRRVNGVSAGRDGESDLRLGGW